MEVEGAASAVARPERRPNIRATTTSQARVAAAEISTAAGSASEPVRSNSCPITHGSTKPPMATAPMNHEVADPVIATWRSAKAIMVANCGARPMPRSAVATQTS